RRIHHRHRAAIRRDERRRGHGDAAEYRHDGRPPALPGARADPRRRQRLTRTGQSIHGGAMESRNLGLIRALGWERTPHGVDFRCATELLAPARVSVEPAGPRAVRLRITASATPQPKRQTYVVRRPEGGEAHVETHEGRVIVRTTHLVVEATLDPWQLT